MERHRQGSFDCSVLIMLTKYCSQSREMASNASSSRLTRPRKSDVSSRCRPFAEFSSVAGANAPAFVERAGGLLTAASCRIVSPELTLRPSLSVHAGSQDCLLDQYVSPELTLRPSLSDVLRVVRLHCDQSGVAGANAPAFVERRRGRRSYWSRRSTPHLDVSPELTLRPSLSVD